MQRPVVLDVSGAERGAVVDALHYEASSREGGPRDLNEHSEDLTEYSENSTAGSLGLLGGVRRLWHRALRSMSSPTASNAVGASRSPSTN